MFCLRRCFSFFVALKYENGTYVNITGGDFIPTAIQFILGDFETR